MESKEKLKKDQIKEMISMRKNGVSVLKLATFFNRDHSTIIYHLKKTQTISSESLKPGPKAIPEIIQKPIKPELLLPEKLNEGKKSYKEYLKVLAEKEGRTLKYYLYNGRQNKEKY